MSDTESKRLNEILMGDIKAPESVAELRAMVDGFIPVMNDGLPEVGAVHDDVLVGEVDGVRVTADVIAPPGDGPHPVLVYFHGGGWVAGSAKSHRKLAFRFAEAGFLVFTIDYRLAPEAPFPAPFDDCALALRWAAAVAPEYGGDPGRLAVGGDSAGGNLAAAVAAAANGDPRFPTIRAALLIYGVFDFAAMPSGEGGEPSVDMMIKAYLGEDPSALLADTRVSPLSVAAQLPPSFVVVGGEDALVGQSAALADALDKAGIEHEHLVVAGMPHAFVQLEMFPQARETIDRMVTFLEKHLQ